MSTLAEMVEMVRDIVYGSRPDLRPLKDRIEGTIDAAVVAFELETPAMWKRGAQVQFEPDGEIVELREDHPSAGDVNVFQRAERGTAAAAHTADDTVLRDPYLPRHQIEQKINDVIDGDLWPIVWLRNERTVSGYDSSIEVYELAAGDVAVEQMYQYDINDDDRIHLLPSAWYEVINRAASGVPTGGTSGKALRVFHVVNDAETVHYTAQSIPSSVTPAGLTTPLVEMVVVGAAGKLLAQAPAQRRQPGGQTRTREQTTDYGLMMAEFTRLRTQYATRLRLELMQQKRYKSGPVRGVPW